MTTTENGQREELAQIVYLSTYPDPASTGIQPLAERAKWEQDSHRGAADAILAAGYRKTRTITTAEELDGLPEGSAVLDGVVCVKRADGYWNFSDLAGVYASASITLPATVLHEPEAEVGA